MSDKPKILIVEDHAVTRSIYTAFLNHDGYDVVEAGDGDEGVSLAVRERPDVILMDIRMPRMDGIEASRAIRSQSGLEAIPIIAVTADAFDLAEQREAKNLFRAILSKPVRPNQLLEHIRSISGAP